MPIYLNQEGHHNKFWRYEHLDGSRVLIEWGRIGSRTEQQTKSFPSSYSRDQFLNTKIREKEGKGYQLSTEEHLQKEEKTAQSLGLENKISRLQWVSLAGSNLRCLEAYDPAQYVYVEVLNSWSKEITRLLLSKTGSWQISGEVQEKNRVISFLRKTMVNDKGSQFANAVRQKLKEMFAAVTRAIKTVKFAAMGARNLFDEDSDDTVEMPQIPGLETAGFSNQVIGKFAALGARELEL